LVIDLCLDQLHLVGNQRLTGLVFCIHFPQVIIGGDDPVFQLGFRRILYFDPQVNDLLIGADQFLQFIDF
jgi:hypothetical protein